MDNIFTYAVIAFTSLFTLMDPLGVMPVFLEMTDGLENKERRHIAFKACLVTCLLLLLFAVSGKFLFQFFGISTNGFRIVGGIIIFKIGYDMLQARLTNIKMNDSERGSCSYNDNITITPLAIPLLCGPGAIATVITLMQDAPDNVSKMVMLGVIVFTCFVSFVILCASTSLLRILGKTGNNVIMRLMGLILMVIAVECFISGMRPILTDIIAQAVN